MTPQQQSDAIRNLLARAHAAWKWQRFEGVKQ